jgi:copper chaperone
MKTKIIVKGMHCKSCEMLVTEALMENGATKASASFKQGVVEIEHDEKTLSVSKAKEIIRKEGYDA